MTLLILAAGKGSRYGGLKQFDGVGPNDQYLLEFNCYDAIQAGATKIVLVVDPNYQDELLLYLRKRIPSSVSLACVGQSLTDLPQSIKKPADRTKPWGTAHAVWCARHEIDEPFVVVNADDLYGSKALNAAFTCGNSTDSLALIGYRLADTLSPHGTVSRGICEVKDGLLQRVVEYSKILNSEGQIMDKATDTAFSGQEPTSMNLWILNPFIFSSIEHELVAFLAEPTHLQNGELYIPTVVQSLIANENVKTFLHPTESEWYGMTYAQDKLKLQEALQDLCDDGSYPVSLWT